jgi:hypothetical protein
MLPIMQMNMKMNLIRMIILMKMKIFRNHKRMALKRMKTIRLEMKRKVLKVRMNLP